MIKKGSVYGGRYELVSHIAVGGMGEVWRAYDRLRDRLVAIKVLRDDLAGDKHFLQRLAIEATNARRMQHPNLAAVLDHGEDNQVGWLVMELVEGYPLIDYLENGQTLTVAQLLPLLYQAALALTAVHSAGVVHRDIKPGNLIIDSTGHLKLTDFGISRAAQQVDLTEVGMVMGTAQYLPPEQAKGEVATPLGDLYGIGIIAYEALVGHRPFTGETQVDIAIAHVKQKVPPLPDTVPALMRTLVMSLLQKNPANRPPDATAFARQVAYVAKQLEVPLTPCPLGVPAVKTADAAEVAEAGDATQSADAGDVLEAADAADALDATLATSSVPAAPSPATAPPAAVAPNPATSPDTAPPAAEAPSAPDLPQEAPSAPKELGLDEKPTPISEWGQRGQSWDDLLAGVPETSAYSDNSPGMHTAASEDAENASTSNVLQSLTAKDGNFIQNSPLWLLAVIVAVLVVIAVVLQLGLQSLSFSGSPVQEMEGTLWLNHALSV